MIIKEVTIPCEMSSRYVTHLVYRTQQIPVDCYIRYDERQVNAKSILGILSLDLHKGDQVMVVAYTDEEYDLEKIFRKNEDE